MPDDLRALAEAATPGPWCYPYPGKNYITTPVDIDTTEADWGGENLRGYRLSCSDDRNAWRAQDAEFVAAANPAAVLALLDERDALLATWDQERDAAEGYAAEIKTLRAEVERIATANAEQSTYFRNLLTERDEARVEASAMGSLVEGVRSLLEHERGELSETRAEVKRLRAALDQATRMPFTAYNRANEAEAAIQRVRALHVMGVGYHGPTQYNLNRCVSNCVGGYPCATIHALDGEATP